MRLSTRESYISGARRLPRQAKLAGDPEMWGIGLWCHKSRGGYAAKVYKVATRKVVFLCAVF
jgi:hypothetical protein